MKILINASLIRGGGAFQYTLSLLEEFRKEDNYFFLVCVSPQIYSKINFDNFNDNFKFYCIDTSPLKIFFLRKYSKIREIEINENPDIVYSPFGPSFYVSKKNQVEGFGDGWCYNPNIFSRIKLGLFNYLKIRFLIFVKKKFIKKYPSKIIVETNDAKTKIFKHIGINKKKIEVIGNTFGSHFYDHKPIGNNNTKDFKLLTLASYYVHKNLEIIPKVLNELNKIKPNYFKFFLTLKNKEFKKFENIEGIYNLGVLNINECPMAYNNVDAMFLPSLLETFSANYPEAMFMKKIIITSDLDFAKDICGNSAMYFNPMDPLDIAQKILQVSNNKILSKNLIDNGTKRVAKFPTSEIRSKKILSVLKSLIIQTNE